MAESSNNHVDALLNLIKSQLLDVNTCIPAKIVAYENGRASVQPSVKKQFADGESLEFPIIQNVRVCWPSFAGGAAGIKGPIFAGDPCLLIFSQQAIDGSDDRRIFDLQDCYAVMSNLGTATAEQAKTNETMNVFYGEAFIKIDGSGKIQINAPGGLAINADVTQNGDMQITGAVEQSGGDLSSNGIILDKHRHAGVMNGPSQTSPPIE